MGKRRERKDRILTNQRKSRIENGHEKRDERNRRETRLKEMLKKGTLPYSPVVMSWLSAAIDKPSRLIVQADVDKYLKS